MKKFELTEESRCFAHPESGREVTVYRIRALKDFTLTNGKKVKVGDLGGWLEREENLSHRGTCWVCDECTMFDGAHRIEDSIGCGNSRQYGDSRQYGNSIQSEYSSQYGDSTQADNSRQYGYSMQYGDSIQSGNSRQYGDSRQFGKSSQSGNSIQFGYSRQSGDSVQHGDSRQAGDFVHTHGQHSSCSNSGQLTKKNELIEVGNQGEFFRCVNYDKTTGLINVNNCFIGYLDEFEEAVLEKYPDTYDYRDFITIVKVFEKKT